MRVHPRFVRGTTEVAAAPGTTYPKGMPWAFGSDMNFVRFIECAVSNEVQNGCSCVRIICKFLTPQTTADASTKKTMKKT
jgi:hypothetical protein